MYIKLDKFRDDELATEVAWVVVYLSALSNIATSMLVKSDVLQLLVERLATSSSLQLLIPVTWNKYNWTDKLLIDLVFVWNNARGAIYMYQYKD